MQNQVVKNIPYPSDFKILKTQRAVEFSWQAQDIIQIMHKQHIDGIRLFVEKNVSNELNKTDISNIEFNDIKWIAPSVEFFFEDNSIPTFILCLQEKGKHNQPFSGRITHYMDIKEEDPCLIQLLYAFYDIDNKIKYRYFNRLPSQIKTWTIESEIPEMK
jgi:hypothetical protein